MQLHGTTGVILPNVSGVKVQFVALLQTVADGLGHALYLGTKKSVSAMTMRPCRSCNCTSSRRRTVYDFLDPECPLLLTTTRSHLRDMQLVDGNAKYSKFLGGSNQPVLS